MGYENPNVVKEVYLPFKYDKWTGYSGKFAVFAENYKKEYGIDLHDIFELNIKDNTRTLKIKGINKIYIVGDNFYNDGYLVTELSSAGEFTHLGTDEAGRLLEIVTCGIKVRDEFGLDLLITTNANISNIDDFDVEINEF